MIGKDVGVSVRCMNFSGPQGGKVDMTEKRRLSSFT